MSTPVFASLKEVLTHLEAEGKRIGKSKLYQDKSKGLLKAQPDGTFKRRDVDRYAASLPSNALPEKKTAEAQEYADRKARAEAEKLEEQVRAERHKNEIREGRYILREDVEVELAARAGVLATGLRNMFETALLDLIHLVDGQPGKAHDLLTAYERMLDTTLNEYARPIDYEVHLDADPAEPQDHDD